MFKIEKCVVAVMIIFYIYLYFLLFIFIPDLPGYIHYTQFQPTHL